MGKAANRKQQERREARDRPRLLDLLYETRQFLNLSARAYDDGYEAESKRIAVSLRVLLHDTPQSHSLMHQLGLKASLSWVDTAERINPNNLIVAHPGLVIMRATMTESGVEGTYVPPLGDLAPSRLHPPQPFNPWWTNDVMRDGNGTTWSRKDLVLMLANKEGGAHVDPKLTDKYEQLVSHNGLGWMAGHPDAGEPFGGNAVAAAVRQIAFEVEETLRSQASSLA
jgi:hypothetical protein